MIDLGVIAQFRDEAPYLPEWIRYHRLAGVGHFWLYDDSSADDWKSAIDRHLRDGVVEVTPLSSVEKADPRSPACGRQVVAFRHGLRRARGQARWVALIDVDEFLLPTIDDTVPACLEQRFAHAHGVYANWRMFGTSGVTVPLGSALLGKLTACSARENRDNHNGKSLVRPDRVDLDDVWYPHHFPLVVGSTYADGSGGELPHRINPINMLPDLVPVAHRDRYIRINHYNLRDEGFYLRNRVPRAQAGSLPDKNLKQLMEHHRSFGIATDRRIIEFLSRRFPGGIEQWNKETT